MKPAPTKSRAPLGDPHGPLSSACSGPGRWVGGAGRTRSSQPVRAVPRTGSPGPPPTVGRPAGASPGTRGARDASCRLLRHALRPTPGLLPDRAGASSLLSCFERLPAPLREPRAPRAAGSGGSPGPGRPFRSLSVRHASAGTDDPEKAERLRAAFEVGSVLGTVRRGIAALGIPDGERLDVHSMRRASAIDSHRAAVPVDVARRATGHEIVAMDHHDQREAGGDDVAEVYRAVAAGPARSGLRWSGCSIPSMVPAGGRLVLVSPYARPAPLPLAGPG